MPLQIILADLLMPIGMSAALLLLLRFIRGSFERKIQERKDKSTGNGRKPSLRTTSWNTATASVSPETEFTEKTPSSTRSWLRRAGGV